MLAVVGHPDKHMYTLVMMAMVVLGTRALRALCLRCLCVNKTLKRALSVLPLKTSARERVHRQRQRSANVCVPSLACSREI